MPVSDSRLPPSPQNKPSLEDYWFAWWHRGFSEAQWRSILESFFHPGNVFSFAFIALIIGLSMQGSVAAGVLSASVLTAVAPYLLIFCGLFVVVSLGLTIIWAIDKLGQDYRAIFKKFKAESDFLKKDCDAKTNSQVKQSLNLMKNGPEFIDRLKYFGLDINDAGKFPDNVRCNAEAHSDSEDEAEHLTQNPRAFIPTAIVQFLEKGQFDYWQYTRFTIRDWFTHPFNVAAFSTASTLLVIAIILTACYFAGVASFMAPVFNTFIGFFEAAFIGLGWGTGVSAFGAYHLAATLFAGVAFCFGPMNLMATLQRAARILYNFLDGLLAEPPAGFAARQREEAAPKRPGVEEGNPSSNNPVVVSVTLDSKTVANPLTQIPTPTT